MYVVNGINTKTKVLCDQKVNEVSVCSELLGRVIDAFGNPLDGKGPIKSRFNMRNPIGKKGWKHGLYESWYRNGQLQSVKEYDMGDEIWSKCEFWDEYGNDITEKVKKELES